MPPAPAPHIRVLLLSDGRPGHYRQSEGVVAALQRRGPVLVDRVELRTIDPACNPYLAFAVVLAAGMKGIEEGYELPREAEDDVWALTERERKSLGIDPLPENLDEAIGMAEDSELLAETLGEHVFDFFLRNKRAEWAAYREQVTAYERSRMLPVI